MKNQRKILITGADGFVGNHLCKMLGDNFEIVRLITPGLKSDRCNTFSIDLASKEEVTVFGDKFKNKSFYAVIHLAFILCKPGDWDNFVYLHKNNQITENMIELCKKLSCENLLNFSSLAVYPNRDGNYDETSQVDPSTNTECLYGLAKFNSEILFTRFLSGKMNIVNLRMCQAYGSGMQDDRLIGLFRKELKGKNTITVFGNGERVSNFIHIDDVVNALEEVLENPVAGTYNLACNKSISYYELAEKIIAAYGNQKSEIIKVNKGINAKVLINGSKFEEVFEFICQKNDFNF